MQSCSPQTITLQSARQTGTAELAVGEDKGLAHAALFEYGANGEALVIIADFVKALLHRRSRLIRTRHFDGDRVLQVAACQTLDLGRERGAEQQRGAGLGQVRKNALQIRQKADIQHAVGLVQHHIFDLIEHDVLGFNMVQQTPWCCHQNFHTALELGRLWLHVHAAEHHHAAQLGVLGVQRNLLSHLIGQLACRQKHQSPHWVAGWRSRRVFMAHQSLQQRQRKGCGFTRARLGCTHDILASQHDRNGLRLDGRHGLVTHVGNSARQGFSQLKIGKRTCH